MKRYSKQEISSGITNGNGEILVYLSRKYFPAARRQLRLRGFRDEETPGIYADVLAAVFASLKHKHTDHIDLDRYFTNALNDEIGKRKERRFDSASPLSSASVEVVAQCLGIMDDQAKNLLFARVSEKHSYEHIAEKFQFSNPVIAQYEFNKALTQLEGIVKLRMNISRN